MRKDIIIDKSLCINCGICIKICPAKVFLQNKETACISDTESCIVCGHCVAACPKSCISHQNFPEHKVHSFDRNMLPTPEQLMVLLKARRSYRAFSKAAVPQEDINMILEAAHRAPTASNSQTVEFTLITDPDTLKMVSEFTINKFSSIVKKLEIPLINSIIKLLAPDLYKYIPAFKRMQREYDNGNDMVLRGATALLLIHTQKSSKFGCEDSNLAYQNGSLMAETLGIGQFYTGFVCVASRMKKKNGLAKQLGIDGVIHAGMALGVQTFKYSKYIDKKDIEINTL